MKISYSIINGRKYAYTCTSERVPGKKNPVSRRTYLGVVDPETGEIIPKRRSASADTGFHGPRVKSYGDSIIVYKMAERLHMVKDLDSMFGRTGKYILAIVLALATRSSSPLEIGQTLKTSSICDLLGIDVREFDVKKVTKIINGLSREMMVAYSSSLWSRNAGPVYVRRYCMMMSERVGRLLAILWGVPIYEGVTLLLCVGCNGSILDIRVLDPRKQERRELLEYLESLREKTERCVFICDPMSMDLHGLEDLIVRDLDFMIGFNGFSDEYGVISSLFPDIDEPRFTVIRDGRKFQCIEGNVGFIYENGHQTILSETDERYPHRSFSLRSCIVHLPGLNDMLADSYIGKLRKIRARYNGEIIDRDSISRELPTNLLEHLSMVPDLEGRLKITLKREEVERIRMNAGSIAVLSTSSDIDEIHEVFENSRYTLPEIEQFLDGVGECIPVLGEDINLEGVMFLEFLVLSIHNEIGKVMKKGDSQMDSHSVLYTASSFKMVEVGGRFVASSCDKDVSELLSMFGYNLEDVDNDNTHSEW